MSVNKKIIKPVLLRFTEEELAAIEWLTTKTMRKRSNAIKWAVLKTAEEMGYVPKKGQKK
jgi:hypothetical protein